jgi:hypothetical protein
MGQYSFLPVGCLYQPDPAIYHIGCCLSIIATSLEAAETYELNTVHMIDPLQDM